MSSTLALIVAAIALLFNGTMAGVFFAFSNSVMPGLNAVAADQAAGAMRSVNRKILNPAFLAAFTLAPIASLIAGVLLLTMDGTAAAVCFLAATVVYVLGSILPTSVVNVPLNNALESSGLDWPAYSPRWTRWNHLRTAACTAALLLSGAGLHVWP
jgi:uncharacterized membrane protein